ncbi:hypothetical protein KIN20_007793 [Parelaphostrongylus tenuis]|uniref:SAC3/GANP/THP3 conserved domain-containing protein n=1 Tax=Parelaphostrongylus tenuis TaxID=148309 RepID=A0AAD5MQ33_PARTN|nr:hypothetical protein KIN20_007793 [Parelaphostrongylus tenuis]
MSFEGGFKIPGSFLKKKVDQSHSEGVRTKPSETVPPVRRPGILSSRLFGNLTRGGPTSVQSALRTEGSSSRLPGYRSSFLKPENRRYEGLLHRGGYSDPSHKKPPSTFGMNDSVSRFKLVRNLSENTKQRNEAGKVGDEPVPSSLFSRKRSSSSLASAAAVRRATKLVRAKRSSSREEAAEVAKQAADFNFSTSSVTSQAPTESHFVSPSKFRAASFAAESKTTTRDEAVVLRSLLALVGRHCPTDYDRYLVLEERDKLLSKLRDEEDKKNDGRTRVARGHCTGMCPEKERYVRVVQKRISQFECGADGSLKPHLMVKEYARSAADQDEPLPHELRSKALLENTMNYLLKNVLDAMPKNDDDMSMWYDFLWNRTRAIRKEITQLMLSDRTAVALIERCARLHILFAYKLCHLDVDKFDQNMNTENLAKCLQSLRHLYEDLRLHGNVIDTEAEFRGYDVMLHLHDNNTLGQVLSYRKEVRESKPVRLALQLSSALHNKNYVKFFRLLKKEATFLQCCICHRYFNTVQSQALLTMMAAYGRNPVFTLDTILRILAWNDRNDALTSLAQYGVFQNDMDCDQVILNRDIFIQDASVPLRPYRWIDEKNTDRLSQVAYGPLPFSFSSISSEINSFDDAGRYNNDPVIAEVFERYSLQSEAQQQKLTRDYPSEKRIVSPFAEHHQLEPWIKCLVENTLHEATDDQSFLIYRDVFVEEVAKSISDHLLEDITRFNDHLKNHVYAVIVIYFHTFTAYSFYFFLT